MKETFSFALAKGFAQTSILCTFLFRLADQHCIVSIHYQMEGCIGLFIPADDQEISLQKAELHWTYLDSTMQRLDLKQLCNTATILKVGLLFNLNLIVFVLFMKCSSQDDTSACTLYDLEVYTFPPEV